MLTRIAPILAVAYWTSVHSEQLGAQIPTRSPVLTPTASRARASRSTSARSSAYVHRLPCATSTSASRSPNRSTVASKLSPIVISSSGVSVSPRVCERVGSSVTGGAAVIGGLRAWGGGRSHPHPTPRNHRAQGDRPEVERTHITCRPRRDQAGPSVAAGGGRWT